MLLALRYQFWRWVHDTLECTWHWSYYAHLKELENLRHDNVAMCSSPRYFLFNTREPSPADRAAGVERVEIWGSPDG